MAISYFLLKPDSEKKFGDIKEEIEQNFDNVQYFAVLDWEHTIKSVYKEHYDRKGEKFANNYQAFIDMMKELYGNYGIIVLIKEDADEKKLSEKVMEFKSMIRNKYCKLGELGIISNWQYGKEIKNNVGTFDKGELKKSPKYMDKIGNYRFHFLNYIHSPDSEESSKNELKILMRNNNLNEDNIIPKDVLNKIIKYKSFAVIEECDKQKYSGEEL